MSFESISARSSIDYMLRTTQQHHVQLSAMADQKANIVVAFSSVVFTVSLTQLGAMQLPIGFFTLAAVSAFALLFAVLSLMPRFSRSRNKAVDIPLNPLFFGHFTELSEDDYLKEMTTVLSSDHATYEAVVRDIYQIGKVLQKKKYFYLGLSYRFFLFGVGISAIVFLAEFLLTR